MPVLIKLVQIRQYRDYGGTSARGYEEDHLIPLELGGSPRSVQNLWPESHPASYTKDGVEAALNHSVRGGRVGLAQRAIATTGRRPSMCSA